MSEFTLKRRPLADRHPESAEEIRALEARADRSEAEFCACKALLIAAQKRGERAEAERAAVEDRLSEARAALDAIVKLLGRRYGGGGIHEEVKKIADRAALAALPVEPARPRDEWERRNAIRIALAEVAGARDHNRRHEDAEHHLECAARVLTAELARGSDQPAQKSEPPGPTGDT